MVVINHCNPHQLNAYPTVPLSQSVIASVQQDFAIGNFARFGNPYVTVSIQNRPDFHYASHYSIRDRLDLEGFLEQFLVIDSRTADSHAIWYVETTKTSRDYTAMAIEGGEPPVTYPGEDSTVWQARILTQDVPVQWASLDVGATDLAQDIEQYTHPYDPHNPQQEPFTLGLNFSRKEDAQGFLGPAYIEAGFEEVDWSTDIEDRKRFLPVPPVVVRLTEEAALEAGLLSTWSFAQHVPRHGETVSMTAPYDWDSPKWSLARTNVSKRGLGNVLVILDNKNNSGRACQQSRILGQRYSGIRNLSSEGNLSALLPFARSESKTLR